MINRNNLFYKICNFSNKFFLLFSVILILGFPIINFFEFVLLLFAIIIIFFSKIRFVPIYFFLLLFIILLIINIFFNKSEIQIGHNLVILNEDSKSLYKDNLPKNIYNFFEEKYSKIKNYSICSQIEDRCWKSFSPTKEKLSGWDKKSFFYKSSYASKKIKYSTIRRDINIDNFISLKINSINNLDFNFYSINNEQDYLNRYNIPYFIYFEVPDSLIEKKLCWKGSLFFKSVITNEFIQTQNTEYNCSYILKKLDSLEFFAVSEGQKDDLKIKFNYEYKLITNLIKLLLIFVIFYIFLNLEKKTFILSFFYSITSYPLILYISPDLIYGLSIFSGGNDGITYMSYANQLFLHFYNLNFYEFFRGMESVFYYPSSLRYFWVFNKLLFSDTFFGYLIIVFLYPIILYYLIINFVSKKMTILIILIFILTRLFEGYAFSLIVMIDHVNNGDAEPLAILCFLIPLTLFFKYINQPVLKQNYLIFLIIGFLLFFSISLRPNYLPSAIILIIIIVLFEIVNTKKIKSSFFLIFGFSFILLIPLHNLYFGNEYILLSSGSNHNTHAPLNLWYNFFYDTLIFDFDAANHKNVIKQFNRWIKIDQFHYAFSFILTLVAFFYKKNKFIIILSLICLSQHLVLLIYEPEGRYSYFAWMLNILILIYYLEVFIKKIKLQKLIGVKY